MEMLLWPLVATIVIELAVLLYLGERHKKVLWASVGINILTNVPLNIVVSYVDDIWFSLIIGELVVVIVEALCYWWLVRGWQQAVVYSLLCNAISFLVGELFVLIFYFLHHI